MIFSIKNMGNKKLLGLATLLGILLFFVAAFSQTGLAKELENQYPKIPIPIGTEIRNLSLNDIFGAISGDENSPAYDVFRGKDPLGSLIFYFYSFSIVIVGIIAFGVIIITGVKFMTSGANPGMRKEAMDQLRAVILGIALLLGSVILLNTINPELTILHKPGEERAFGALEKLKFGERASEQNPFEINIDIDSLKYGGVVLYNDLNMQGEAGDADRQNRSSTVLNNVPDFASGLWIGADKLSGVRILGNCKITLFGDENYDPKEGAWDSNGPGTFQSKVEGGTFADDEASSIKITDSNCLGEAITAYEDSSSEWENGIPGVPGKGTVPFIYDVADLTGEEDPDIFRKPNGDKRINDAIGAIMSNKRPPSSDFGVRLCTKKNWEDCHDEIDRSVIALEKDVAFGDKWNNSISSISLGGTGINRQAGVILYNKENFRGTSEVFIASDKALRSKGSNYNFVSIDPQKSTASVSPMGGVNDDEYVSSLIIIGKYVVTLYSEPNFLDHRLKIDNATSSPVATFVANNGAMETIKLSRGTDGALKIPKLSDFQFPGSNNWGDDKVQSIKLRVPKDIFDEQRLERVCDEEVPGLCTLGTSVPTP